MNVTMTNGFIFQIINLLMVSWGGGGMLYLAGLLTGYIDTGSYTNTLYMLQCPICTFILENSSRYGNTVLYVITHQP